MTNVPRVGELLRAHLREGDDCPVCGGLYSTSTPRPLLASQEKLLNWWIDYREEHGWWPKLTDAAEAFGVAKATIHGRLVALRNKGYMLAPPSPGITAGWKALSRPPGRRNVGPPGG